MAEIKQHIQFKLVIVFTISSILYGLILFYVDEGRYSLNGILTASNIFGLLFYIVPAIGMMILGFEILINYIKYIYTILIIIILGPPVGFTTLIGGMMLISKILWISKTLEMKLYEVITFIILTILLSVLIYLVNDDTQPIIGILRFNYLVPTTSYALVVSTVCFSIHWLLKHKLNKILSLVISILFGVPLGLKLLFLILGN